MSRIIFFFTLLIGVFSGSLLLGENQKKPASPVSGIIFFSTQKLMDLSEFYIDRIGCELWLDQGGCRIFRCGNLLLGFCEGKEADLKGMITFFFADKKDVDSRYQQLEDISTSKPKENAKYRIYHFFAQDPEGRILEFQYFMHPLQWDFKK